MTQHVVFLYVVCDSCRKAVLKLVPALSLEPEKSLNNEAVEIEEGFQLLTPEKSQAIETLNTSLSLIDETPVKRKRLSEKKYPEIKFKKVTEAFRTKLLGLSPENPIQTINNGQEIINQLKEKFNSTTNKSLKIQILTTLPKSWTLKQIETEFGVTNLLLEKLKILLKKNLSCLLLTLSLESH